MRARMLSLTLLAAVAACSGPDLTAAGGEPGPQRRAAAVPAPACVLFNVPALGAVFGAPVGTPPGAVIWVESAINVSVNPFRTTGGPFIYNWMRIENAPAVFTLGAGKTGHTNNINAGFDFTGLGFPVKRVEFVWLNLGGYENLSINGSPHFVGQLSAPPPAIAGVAVATAWAPVAGGKQGRTTLTGAITKIQVGGQEEWLDTVCAYP